MPRGENKGNEQSLAEIRLPRNQLNEMCSMDTCIISHDLESSQADCPLETTGSRSVYCVIMPRLKCRFVAKPHGYATFTLHKSAFLVAVRARA